MAERETWYVLENGDVCHPSEVVADDKGALRHKNGVAVAMRGDAYSSRSVDPEEERAKRKDLKPEASRRGYRTRETKAEE